MFETPNLLKYPKNGTLYPSRGLNKADNRLQVRPDEAVDLMNWLFVGETLLQRAPFRPFSTTNFATPGRFRGAHDYQAPGAAARLLFYCNNGTIKEFLTASTEADRVTGLATGIEGDFVTAYDSVAFVNGSDTPRIGRGTSWRALGSPAAVSNLAVGTSGAAGIAAGTYLHIVVPVIDVSGVAVVFADWSNIVRTAIGAAVTQFNLTWTDVVDSRVTRYLIFRTEAGATDLRSVGAVNAGVGAFTDNFADSSLPVVVSGGPSRPSPQYSWGVPPVSKLVSFAGNRMVFGNIPSGSKQNAFQLSRKAGSAYECEGVPADGSTLIRLPGDGDLTALIPIGTTDPLGRANDLFVGQPTACYILPETNPEYPLTVISEYLGPISKNAWAKDGNWIFFQSRRGVEFWPGAGRDIYLISTKVQPIFNGGGPQQVSGSVSDSDIQYEVAENQLWITVRDDASATGANLVYTLDLLKFKREFNPQNPNYSVRFSGPHKNGDAAGAHLGFGILLLRHDGTLINFDNQNNRILSYDADGSQDSIAGANTDMPARIEQTGIMRENLSPQKVLCNGKLYLMSSSTATLEIRAEFDRVISQIRVDANAYGFEWDDIEWDDIAWTYQTWFSDLQFEFCEAVGKWFTFILEKEDSESGAAYGGIEIFFDTLQQHGTLR
jgi:hypothetical protein